MSERPTSFAADFPVADRDQWRALADKALKGGDYATRLIARTVDGLPIEPIYARRADGAVTAGAKAGKWWSVVARVDHPDAAGAATLALADLGGGADGLSLVFPNSRSARGYGLECKTVADLDASLKGVLLDLIRLRIEPAVAGYAYAALVVALVKDRGHKPGALAIEFGFDPVGVSACTGRFDAAWDSRARELAETVREFLGYGFNGPFVTCDLRVPHEAGASEAQELAYGLALAVNYARALTGHGIPTAAAYAALSWSVAIDADQLLGLAKLRALRRLWARIEQASGLAPRPICIHAETAWRMLTQRDPAVNMLRATLATFTAGVGGADSIAVLPHTAAVHLPDALARRIARNTQLVVLEESNLWRVADPAAGSGAIETLTDQLCNAAWTQFQQIEREGGIVACLTEGRFQARIAASRNARARAVATRKVTITGTSEFPDLKEEPARSASPQRKLAETVAAQPFAGLPSVRLAQPFEALRDAADTHAKRSGARATVFLANLGPVTDHGVRATWMRNLLASGGIDVISSDGFAASGNVGAAFAASGAAVACICGTDAGYDQFAEAAAVVLKSAGATKVLLAGCPATNETALQAAGVDEFLVEGQDIIALLERLHLWLSITC